MAGCGASNTSALAFGGNPNKAETESWNGSAWTEVNDLNAGRGSHLGGIGIATAALAFGGDVPPPISAITESWNGTSWINDQNLNVARKRLAGSGTSTLGLAFGGDASPLTGATEEWYGDGLLTLNITTS